MSSRIRHRPAALAVLTLALLPACAAQHEEAAGTMPDSEAERAGDMRREFADEPIAAEPAADAEPEEEQGERSLADIERELAVNETRLRQLGVPMPGATATTTKTETAKPKPKKVQGAGAGGVIDASPGTRPSAAPNKGTNKDASQPKSKQDRSSEKKKRPSNREDKNDAFAPPPPDEAKATQLPGGVSPELDAAGRCQAICELSQITCELNAQICELADRHADEDDYQAACERAAEDCDAAQEACDACVG